MTAALTTLDAFPLDGSIRTLGWAVIEWCESGLNQPDGDARRRQFLK